MISEDDCEEVMQIIWTAMMLFGEHLKGRSPAFQREAVMTLKDMIGDMEAEQILFAFVPT